jgi:cytidylate kinase
MPEQLSQLPESQISEPTTPLHGYRGERRADRPFLPGGLTIAISREAGSRGTSIAKRAGEKLGWQVYTQEMLEYLSQEDTGREELIASLSPAALHWVEEQLERLKPGGPCGGDPLLHDMSQVILSLGASGEVILIGRGAGYILSRTSTLHVRVIAPLEDRIAYMSQWQRLTRDEAADLVRLRDHHRADYLRTQHRRDAADIYQYDLLLNSTYLGEELSAELLVQAARAKTAAYLAEATA